MYHSEWANIRLISVLADWSLEIWVWYQNWKYSFGTAQILIPTFLTSRLNYCDTLLIGLPSTQLKRWLLLCLPEAVGEKSINFPLRKRTEKIWNTKIFRLPLLHTRCSVLLPVTFDPHCLAQLRPASLILWQDVYHLATLNRFCKKATRRTMTMTHVSLTVRLTRRAEGEWWEGRVPVGVFCRKRIY